jgi:hypothetical protein
VCFLIWLYKISEKIESKSQKIGFLLVPEPHGELC